MRACVRQDHKPTDDQKFGSASRQVVLAVQPTPKGSPKMLGQFPLRPTGGGRGVRWARIMLRLRSADRKPADPFLTQVQRDGTQAPGLVMVCPG